MLTSPTTAIAEFSPAERDYVRRELDLYFTTLPTVAAGFQLRIWKSGPRKGTPKLPQAAQSMMADPRLANPQKFAHIRRELGLDRDHGAEAAE